MRIVLACVLALSAGCGGAATAAPAAPRPQGPPAPAHREAASAREPSPAPEPPPAPHRRITVAAVGDIMMGTTYPADALPPDDGAQLLSPVAPTLRAADIAFGNLEGPLYDGGGDGKCAAMVQRHPHKQTCWAFRSPTRYVGHLVNAGFDVVSIANNHAWDFGEAGRDSTIATLESAGIAYSGPPGTVATVHAGNMSIGLIAFTTANHSHNLNDLDAAVAAVRAADEDHDLVIVSFHGGAEGRTHQHVPEGAEMFYGENRGDLRTFTHAVIDAGADLVLGHGPHVLRGMEVYKGHLIVYSMGNFVTYRGISIKGPAGITAIATIDVAPDGRFLGGTLTPLVQKRPEGPSPDPRGQAIRLVRSLSNADFPGTAVRVGDDGTLSAP